MSKPKSSVPATTKALQAWQSELRRLEKRLEEWSHELDAREETLQQQEASFEGVLNGADDETVQRYALSQQAEDVADDLDMSDIFTEDGDYDCTDRFVHGVDCGCSPEDAAANCDCPKCKSTRQDWIKAGDSRKFPLSDGFGFPIIAPRREPPKGDEVTWLESLWKLKDNRKKR
jgi:hypothetical protein